jgi:predicted HTH transcriptional regulator
MKLIKNAGSNRVIDNPDQLPPPLTPKALRSPHASIPHNPLLAEPLFLTRYVEKAGTGILDMISLCKAAGVPTPQFRQEGGQFIQTLWRPKVAGTGEVPAQIGTKLALSRHQVDILKKCRKETGLVDLMAITGRADRTKFRHQVLAPLLAEELIEMTIPDKPRSSNQEYRLTVKGRTWLDARGKGGAGK